MSHQFDEAPEPSSPRRMSELFVYSARIQEAMRYDKLSSSDYRLVMTIRHAVSRGLSEEQWKEEQHRTVNLLINQPADEAMPHAEAANGYEQMVDRFKGLLLWPW